MTTHSTFLSFDITAAERAAIDHALDGMADILFDQAASDDDVDALGALVSVARKLQSPVADHWAAKHEALVWELDEADDIRA